jgi:hypothetical protein
MLMGIDFAHCYDVLLAKKAHQDMPKPPRQSMIFEVSNVCLNQEYNQASHHNNEALRGQFHTNRWCWKV